MRADSLLQGIRRIDRQGEQLLSLRTFSGVELGHRIDATMDALVDLAELLRAGAPFPPRVELVSNAGGGRSSRTNVTNPNCTDADRDEFPLVRRVLETSYERGGATTDQLDPGIANRVVTDERFETVDSWVLVPLSGAEPYASNWRPVIETLSARLDRIVEDFRRIVRRVRAAETDRLLINGCEAVVEMLETLLLVVQRADADSRYVRNRTDQRQGELLSTIEQATTQLQPQSNDNA
ncbi:hypothetical protein G6M89_08030 [Natronolimnobius sp. AArcel1]|uniref:hypothetical protein n=1 Tax=Natronolimnobius sp. AArcel1 TaxID=1679093 RepID=UPI0013EA7CA9|nr:hypothetical protein [Natronolimnobius sp. AArcel1]NGM68960.1 hypothetical protein [Natronolimnobius sp. AArcel1]